MVIDVTNDTDLAQIWFTTPYVKASASEKAARVPRLEGSLFKNIALSYIFSSNTC